MALPVVRSHYSLMRGIASPKALCARAKELGYACLAMADRDNLYGLWEFRRACLDNGLRPITGSEVTQPGGVCRAWCLVESAAGFSSLCRLLTRRHTEKGFELGRAVAEEARGLAVLTDHAALLTAWREQGVPACAALPRRPTGASLELRRTARRLGAPMVAIADACFLTPGDLERHMVLRAIAGNTSLSRLDPTDLAPPDAVLVEQGEYARRFAPLPEAMAGAAALAERLSFIPTPGITMPPWDDEQGRSADEVLKARAYAGAAGRYGSPLPGEVVARLERELAIIAGKGFSSYFLVVEDIVGRSPRICGRGSGAASLVAYCLGITNVCPIKFNLYFERFINPQRVDPPDIDVDFAWDERDGVIESVLRQYQGRAAMVATHIFFQGRMAIREVAKVYGLPAQEIKRVTRHLPWLRGPVEGHTGFYPKRQALPPGAKADLAPPPGPRCWPKLRPSWASPATSACTWAGWSSPPAP